MSTGQILAQTALGIYMVWWLVAMSHRLIDWHRDRAIRKLLNKPLLTHDEIEQLLKDALK